MPTVYGFQIMSCKSKQQCATLWQRCILYKSLAFIVEPLAEMYYKKKKKKKGRSYIQYMHSYLYLKESDANPH